MKKLYNTIGLIFTSTLLMFGSEINSTNNSVKTKIDTIIFCDSIENGETPKENDCKRTLEITFKDYSITLPKLYPNPSLIGEFVTITNVTKGEEVFIFDINGVFITSQIVDTDQRIDTIALKKGEYVIRNQTLFLKLYIE